VASWLEELVSSLDSKTSTLQRAAQSSRIGFAYEWGTWAAFGHHFSLAVP